jgi:hypothetical protein
LIFRFFEVACLKRVFAEAEICLKTDNIFALFFKPFGCTILQFIKTNLVYLRICYNNLIIRNSRSKSSVMIVHLSIYNSKKKNHHNDPQRQKNTCIQIQYKRTVLENFRSVNQKFRVSYYSKSVRIFHETGFQNRTDLRK